MSTEQWKPKPGDVVGAKLHFVGGGSVVQPLSSTPEFAPWTSTALREAFERLADDVGVVLDLGLDCDEAISMLNAALRAVNEARKL